MVLVYMSTNAQIKIGTINTSLQQEQRTQIEQKLRDHWIISLDLAGLNALSKTKNSNISIPSFDGEDIVMDVYSKSIKSINYSQTFSSKRAEINDGQASTFRGNTHSGGMVRLTFDDDFIFGMFELNGEMVVIDQLKYFLRDEKIPADRIILYKTGDILSSGVYCGSDDVVKESLQLEQSVEAKTITTNCMILEVATDADFEYNQIYGNNSNNRIIGEFNNIHGVYGNTFNIEIVIVHQNVWTTANDPYNSFNTATVNNEISNTWQTTFGNVDRDLVHMFTGKNLGILGRASGIGNVCSNPNANSYTVDADPVNSYTVAHEIGHNLGAQHPVNDPNSNCGGGINRTVMCQGANIPNIVFSAFSQNEINNYVNSNSGCLFQFDGISDISGNGSMCVNTTRVYTIDVPVEASITWSLTNSHATIISGQGTNSVTVRGQSNGSVQLRATVDLNGTVCTNIIKAKDLAVGTLIPADFRLRDPFTNNPVYFLCRDQPTYVKIAHDGGINPIDWQWNVSGAYITYDNAYSDHSRVTLRPYSYNVTVQVRAQNSCGWSQWGNVSPDIISCGGFFAVYPNPADTEVFIATNTESTVSSQTSVAPRNTMADFGAITMELYDFSGNRVKKEKFTKGTSNIRIDVSSLKKGIYILKLTGKEVDETHLIVIQ